MATHLVLLAAGQGTRMNSDTPKVLHQVGGRALFAHALASADTLGPGERIVVIGTGAESVGAALAEEAPGARTVLQSEQLGTGHAVAQAAPLLRDAGGDTAVLFADTPFVGPDTLTRMADARTDGADIVVLGFQAEDPARYGRLVTDGDTLLRIVEWKDASPEERGINICNSGIILASTELLFDLVEGLSNANKAGEYYLTDIVGLAVARGVTATAVLCDEAETLGVNSRADLARAEAAFQTGRRAEIMGDGVTLTAPDTVHFSYDTVIGRDTVIEPNVVFGPGVTIESGATIRAFSHLEGCHVGARVTVGPFARLRPGAELGNDAHIGNFCEVKNADIGEGAKINHLSYVGDATVGDKTNIGAGTITCNYDGVFKHRTEIGARAFIGSDTMLVAPVRVGNDAMTASGSVITSDVPDGALGLGRGRQVNKPGFATRLFQKLRAAKARQQEKE